MNNLPEQLTTFLYAIQDKCKAPVQVAEMQVDDGSGRLDYVVIVGGQQFVVWNNPDGSWGWTDQPMMRSNFGF